MATGWLARQGVAARVRLLGADVAAARSRQLELLAVVQHTIAAMALAVLATNCSGAGQPPPQALWRWPAR